MNQACEGYRGACQLEGLYANYFEVGYNAVEFLFDFGQFFPESDEKARLHTRIITSPVYANVLLEILRESLAQCEQRFGPIPRQNDQGGTVQPGELI